MNILVKHPLGRLETGLHGRCGSDLKNTIFKLIIQNYSLSTCCEIALWWMPQNITNKKSRLVQIMAWCRQATSHYLSQCWPRYLSPYGVTKPLWATHVRLKVRPHMCGADTGQRHMSSITSGTHFRFSVIDVSGICSKSALTRMPQDHIDDKWFMQWLGACHQATDHYLMQCWPSAVMLHGHVRCQCIDIKPLYSNKDLPRQCSWNTFMVHQTFVRWALYILFKFVKSRQRFGPRYQKCPTCPMIFMNTAKVQLSKPEAHINIFFIDLMIIQKSSVIWDIPLLGFEVNTRQSP